jgi:hypothetical protein
MMESRFVRESSPQFEMNSQNDEVCSNIAVLSNYEEVRVYISSHQTRFLLNLISDSRKY